MANPPPQNPLLPLITTAAMLPTYSVELAEVESDSGDDRPDASHSGITLQSSFEEAVLESAIPWYDDEEYTNFLRLRIIVCTDSAVAQRLDFLQQRFNEYVAGTMGPISQVSGDLLSNQLIRASGGDSITAKLLSTMGPFDAGNLTQNFKQTGSREFWYDERVPGFEALSKVFIYDVPATNMLPLVAGENDSIRRRSTGRTIRLTHGENIDQRVYQIEKVSAFPISFNFGAQGDYFPFSDLSQFSVYSFAYFDVSGYTDGAIDSLGTGVFTVAESGMGYISPKIFSGAYNIYTAQDRPVFVREDGQVQLVSRGRTTMVGFDGRRQVDAPNSDSLHDFRAYSNQPIESLNNRIFENFQRQVGISYVGNKSKIMIGDKNYFSPLWVSKDINENVRYIFTFSLRAFLINNSKYPWLYQNQQSSDELFNGGGIIRSGQRPGPIIDERTKILNYTMSKRLVNFEEFTADNEVGTVLRNKEKPLGPSNEEEVIKDPSLVPGLYLEDNGSDQMLFFEGRDILSDEKVAQQLSRIQYGIRITIKDSAETYILNYIKMLLRAEKKVREVFDFIVHSPVGLTPSDNQPEGLIVGGVGLFDYKSLTIKVPLSRIAFKQIHAGPPRRYQTAEERVQNQLDLYTEALEGFGVVSSAEASRLNQKLVSMYQSPNPQGLQIVADSIGDFAATLAGIVGDAKRRFVGDERQNKKSAIEGRGIFEQKVPILDAVHYFDNFATSGLTFGTGYEYLQETRQNSAGEGILRIAPNEYLSRTLEEFDKYFYAAQEIEGGSSTFAYSPSYSESTAAFLTPYIIRTYGKNKIQQASYRNPHGPNTRYNLDHYGELFADLVTIKDKSTYLKGSYYRIEDETLNDSPNTRLFNSVRSSLINRHYFDVEFDSLLDVPSLEPPKETPDPKRDINKEGKDLDNLLSTVYGGVADLSPAATDWKDAQNKSTQTKYTDDPTKGADTKLNPQKEKVDYPIKLMFSILGELELDKTYYPTPHYSELDFNSMKNQALFLGLTSDNIKEVLENQLASIPNQLKSMYVVAMRSEALMLGNGFEATRNLLQEQDTPVQEGTKVSAFITNANLPYKETYDTMKIYSKMLAYWMNYKEICVVEYLGGFEKTSTDLMQHHKYGLIGGQEVDLSMQGPLIIATNPYTPKPKMPIWKRLTPKSFRGPGHRNLLCRVRRVMTEDLQVKTPEENSSRTIWNV